jgi:hypothetical protein
LPSCCKAHKEGFAWGDMAVLCADWKTMDLCASALAQRKLPHRVRKKSGEYRPGADAIQVMTMKVSKGACTTPILCIFSYIEKSKKHFEGNGNSPVISLCATYERKVSVNGSNALEARNNGHPIRNRHSTVNKKLCHLFDICRL